MMRITFCKNKKEEETADIRSFTKFHIQGMLGVGAIIHGMRAGETVERHMERPWRNGPGGMAFV